MRIEVKSLVGLRKLAAAIQKTAKKGAVIALIGPLGAGKTTFVKFFLRAAGIRQEVTSPTFVLMVPYVKNKQTYWHLDLHRTKNYRDARSIGIEQLWSENYNTLLIEWAQRIYAHLPKKTIVLRFKLSGENRIISIKNAPKSLAKMLR